MYEINRYYYYCYYYYYYNSLKPAWQFDTSDKSAVCPG